VRVCAFSTGRLKGDCGQDWPSHKKLLPRYTILMIRKLVLLSLLTAGFALAQNRVFELRTYTCNEGKLEALKTRFRDHTIEIFKRHGMESIGYWIPQDGERSKTTLIYIIAHASREQAAKNWREFAADPEWKKVAAESEANGKILVKAPESVFMDPADFSQIK
jgi:hypothetical protein